MDVTEKLRPEGQDQLSARVGAQQRATKLLELVEQADDHHEASRQSKHEGAGTRYGHGHHDVEEGRERIEADNAIHSDLERQRAEQHERGRHQAQHEYAADVGPVGPRLAEQPSTERQISVLRGHHTPLLARVKLKGDLV